uniref:Uncharacterized protein n=1 Tax=Schizaphis graminum TaxID=13262 RepID=A0A2S2PIU1_SCHGA
MSPCLRSSVRDCVFGGRTAAQPGVFRVPPARPPRSPGVACLVPKALAPARSPDYTNHENRRRPHPNSPSSSHSVLFNTSQHTYRKRIFFKSVQIFGFRILKHSSPPLHHFTTSPLGYLLCFRIADYEDRSLDLRIFFYPSSPSGLHAPTHPPTH